MRYVGPQCEVKGSVGHRIAITTGTGETGLWASNIYRFVFSGDQETTSGHLLKFNRSVSSIVVTSIANSDPEACATAASIFQRVYGDYPIWYVKFVATQSSGSLAVGNQYRFGYYAITY